MLVVFPFVHRFPLTIEFVIRWSCSSKRRSLGVIFRLNLIEFSCFSREIQLIVNLLRFLSRISGDDRCHFRLFAKSKRKISVEFLFEIDQHEKKKRKIFSLRRVICWVLALIFQWILLGNNDELDLVRRSFFLFGKNNASTRKKDEMLFRPSVFLSFRDEFSRYWRLRQWSYKLIEL